MKRIFALSTGIAALLFLGNCVEGPVTVDDTGHHGPDSATVVTLSNADSLLAANRFGIIEFYSAQCPVCADLVWAIDSLAELFDDSVLMGTNNTDNDTLYKQFSISTVPTYILFKDGAEITRRSFIENKQDVLDTLIALITSIMAGTLEPDTGDTVSSPDTTAPSNYVTLDTLSFDTTVLRHGRVAMVFFLFAGGAPCIYMNSVIETFAPQYDGSAIIAKVHALDQYEISQRYDINSVPHFLFFKDSALVEQRSGVVPGDTLTALLDRLLDAPPEPVLLDVSNFDSLVAEPERIAMIDFYSPFCSACKEMLPVVDTLAESFDGRALIGKVNTMEDDSLSNRFGIEWVPTFIFLDAGVEFLRIVGIVPADSLAGVLDSALNVQL